jgi:hypothetical protein
MVHPFNVTSGVGGKKLGSVTVRHLGESLLDALHINAHGIHGAGDQDGFRGHEISRMGNAVTGNHFGPEQHMPTD